MLAVVLFLILDLPVNAKVNSTCNLLFQGTSQTIYISGTKDRMASPDSLDAVKAMLHHLNKMKSNMVKDSDLRSKIYKAAQGQIERAITMGEKIKNSNVSDQDEAWEFFKIALALIDLPAEYADEIGRLADGFGNVNGFNVKDFKERLSAYYDRHGKEAGEVMPQKILFDVARETLSPQPGDKLEAPFLYLDLNPYGEIPTQVFNFRHLVIFKKGLVPPKTLIKDRERGISYVGIYTKDFAPHDGTYGDARSFSRHDRVHFYLQKYFDSLLFKAFEADTVEKMRSLKEKTNALLQSRVLEYEKLDDPLLRDAIEAWYFAALFEQCQTYPYGIASDFADPDHLSFYKSAIPRAIKSGRLGPQYKHLYKFPEVLEKAFEWVRQRATEDLIQLQTWR